MKTNRKAKTNAPALIRFDWAMKRLLRQKANYTVLEGFLSVLINENVKIINIKESESNQENVNDKFNRVDIFVENSHGELLIIEMQNSDQVDYFLRMLYGVSKAIAEHIIEGEPYRKIRKVYHINIVYFKLGQGKDYVYHGSTEFRGIHHHDLLQLTKKQKDFFACENRHSVNEVKDLYPEYYIICVEDFDNEAKSSLDEWIYYLKNNSIPEDFTAPGLEEARKRLQYDKLSDEEKRDYNHHLKQKVYEQTAIETAILKGEAKGLAKGEAERKKLKAEKEAAQAKLEVTLKTTVLNCHHEGLPIDTISSITGLNQQQISEILKKGLA
jgi:predicted transposase/invertase (TIGR01784 family)